MAVGVAGVVVELDDGSVVRADHGICTLPPHLASALPNPWPDDVRRALKRWDDED